MRLSSVVFPAPFGPTTPTASLADTEKSTPSSTRRAPNIFVRPSPLRRGRPACAPGVAWPMPPSAVIRPEFRLDGNIRVGGVLSHWIVERKPRPRLRLDPLRAD